MWHHLKVVAPILAGSLLWGGAATAEMPTPGHVVMGKEPPSAARSLREELAPPEVPAKAPLFEDRFLAVGLGAIGGVVVFNLATGGTAAVPMMAGAMPALTDAGITAVSARTGAVAVSRVYAISSAVVGAMVGDYLYRRAHKDRIGVVPRPVAERVTPR